MQVFPDLKALDAVCKKYDVARLSLFGSTLKGTNRPDSDIDLLVEFSPDARPALFDVVGLESDLSDLLGGRKLDVRTAGDLSPYFRNDVVATADLQYAA
jgi:predicted nucleotidyltransferase